MDFDLHSEKMRRSVGILLLILAPLLAIPFPWIALVAAGLGVTALALHGPGCSWRGFIKKAGGKLVSLFHWTSESETFQEEAGSPLPAMPISRRRSPGDDPDRHSRTESGIPALPLPYSRDAWAFPGPAKKAPEDTLHPQRSIFLTAGSTAAGPAAGRVQAGSEPAEVIDLESILRNMEKRCSAKRSSRQARDEKSDSAREQPVTIGFDEVRDRLLKRNGRKLSAKSEPTPPASGRSLQEPVSADSRVDAPACGPLLPSESPGGNGKAAATALADLDAACHPASGLKISIDSSFFTQPRIAAKPVDAPSMQAPKGSPPPVAIVPSQQRPAANETGALRGQCCAELFSEPAADWSPERRPFDANRPVESSASENMSRIPRAEMTDDFCLPPLSLLQTADSAVTLVSQDDLIETGILIEEKLAEFRVKVNVQDAFAGPVITRYEVQPAVGVRGGQVVSLMKDLARALGLAAIRVVETIPGKTCMGLELPNPSRQMIRLSEVLSSAFFQSHPSKLALALGKDIVGEPVVADLARAPHLLVAGTTGSGKSVGVNAMILSLLYRASPDEVRMLMIDPKMLELSIYDGIPHLLAPVVTDMKLAANALNWCVGEMERRYSLMSRMRVRNLEGYNQKVRDAVDAGAPLVDPLLAAQDDPSPLLPLPYIVVVIDELADLMMVSGKKIEELIARLAQKARAAGIHLIIATQRPSVDVITGLIKANIPTRIAFQVSSKVDSRTILDQMGAECLLGQGDMLYLPPGTGYPQRVHGAFVADEEVQAVAEYLKQLGEPDYIDEVLRGTPYEEDGTAEAERFTEDTDPLYDEAVAFVLSSRRASISSVQRQMRIGYNRAARLIEQMEASGLVSPMESNGNRTVLVPAKPE